MQYCFIQGNRGLSIRTMIDAMYFIGCEHESRFAVAMIVRILTQKRKTGTQDGREQSRQLPACVLVASRPRCGVTCGV